MTHARLIGLVAAGMLMHTGAASAQPEAQESTAKDEPVSLPDYEERARKAERDGDPTLAGQIHMLAYQEHRRFKSLDAAGRAFIAAGRNDLAYEATARFYCASDYPKHRSILAERLQLLQPDNAIPTCGDEGQAGEFAEAPVGNSVFHMGVNLRTDIGTHPFRFDFGIRTQAVDVTLVLDPMLMIDGQHDADLLVARNSDWSPFAGYRLTTIALANATHKQHKLLVGLVANLPKIGKGTIAGQLGLEMSTLIAKHGAGLPTESLFASNGRDFIDLINFGMFLRFEYGSKF